MDTPRKYPDRKKPVHGVHVKPDTPTIVFVTVCTHDRTPWLANDAAHAALRGVWMAACGWKTGKYVLMPDHVHFFVAPDSGTHSLESWITYWKRLVVRAMDRPDCRWQSGYWDTRMRSGEKCQQKWHYIQENPVRKGLVEKAEQWPWRGEVFTLSW
jgi:putative transposase